MKNLRKILFFIFTVIIFTASSQSAFCKMIKKEIQAQTKDTSVIRAILTYNQTAGVTKYPTVLLLHSLGYSSKDWGPLINNLNNSGFAVIAMDLRGHGESVYNGKLQQKGWAYFTSVTYQKFPNDVIALLKQAQQIKELDLNRLAMVGADIGANTAVLAAKDMKIKPKTMVLISPTTTLKSLYIPLALTELNLPILSMASTKDRLSMQEQLKLAKFSQGGFYAKNYPNGGMGMLMIKVNPTMSQDIVKWVSKYLK